jgi:thiamine pyrophosphate-dependent acetolactate synthase large subunit-like protein
MTDVSYKPACALGGLKSWRCDQGRGWERHERMSVTADPSVAGQILRALGDAGATTTFGLAGVHNLAFWREPPLPSGRLVMVRHEQTAMYAADGWARASGCLGAAIVTTGPGAANTTAAFGEAAMSRSPVVLVASEVPRRLTTAGIDNALHQSKDQSAIFASLAKAVFTPRSAQEVADAFGVAIATALSAPRGPVYVDVPADVLSETGLGIDIPEIQSTPVDTEALDRAVARLDAAGSLVIWAGGGVVEAGATDDLAELAIHLDAPVVTTFASRGAIGFSHPSNVGLPPHEPEVEALLAGAEVLLAIGSDFDAMMTKNRALQLPPIIVDVNVALERTEIGYPGVLPVVGDAKQVIRSLLERTQTRERSLLSSLPSLRARVWGRLRSDPRTAEACVFVDTIQRVASGVAVVVNDMSIPGYWLSSYYGTDRPRTVQYPVGWGTLGYAVPASIGAACVNSRPVLAVCGDGGFMFAIGELATLAQEHLPVTVLIVDDQGYGMLRFEQQRAGAEHRGVDLVNPDFVMLAHSFGLPALRVEGVGSELASALTHALASQRPNVVVCGASLYPPRTTSPRWNEPL